MIHQPKLARLPVIKATTLLLLSLYPLIGGAEERILEFEGAGIKISAYSDTTPSEKLTLRVESSQVDNVEIFTVNEPNRLVIDLLGVQFKSHDEFSLKSNRFAERLRLGAHKNKMRLVLDLLGADFPKYLYRQKTGQLEIELGESGDSKILEGVVDKPIAQAPTQSPLPRPRVISVMKQTPETLASSVEPSPTPIAANNLTPSPRSTIAVSPTPTAILTSSPTTTPTLTASPTITATTTMTRTPVPTQTANQTPTVRPTPSSQLGSSTGKLSIESAQLAIVGIDFVYLKNKQPVIKASLNRKSSFKLIKKDDRTYTLTIGGASLSAAHLSLPRFPPHDFAGFSYVQAGQLGKSVTLTIGVERGVRINANASGSDILIRPLNR